MHFLKMAFGSLDFGATAEALDVPAVEEAVLPPPAEEEKKLEEKQEASGGVEAAVEVEQVCVEVQKPTQIVQYTVEEMREIAKNMGELDKEEEGALEATKKMIEIQKCLAPAAVAKKAYRPRYNGRGQLPEWAPIWDRGQYELRQEPTEDIHEFNIDIVRNGVYRKDFRHLFWSNLETGHPKPNKSPSYAYSEYAQGIMQNEPGNRRHHKDSVTTDSNPDVERSQRRGNGNYRGRYRGRRAHGNNNNNRDYRSDNYDTDKRSSGADANGSTNYSNNRAWNNRGHRANRSRGYRGRRYNNNNYQSSARKNDSTSDKKE